jgi:hypothetical protein
MTAERGLELRAGIMKRSAVSGSENSPCKSRKSAPGLCPASKVCRPGHGDIGNVTAGWLIFEVGRTIEQPEIGPIKDSGEFR